MTRTRTRIPKIKRRLTSSEEFDIMKLVLDKFLWIGTGLMAWGLYQSIIDNLDGIYFIIAGAVVLAIFSIIIVREFEQIR